MGCKPIAIQDPGENSDLFVRAGNTQPLTLTLKDRKTEVPFTEELTLGLTTLTLTLLDKNGNVINDVLDVDIHNTDRGKVNSDGTVTITLRKEDTVPVGWNVVDVQWTWTDSDTLEPQKDGLQWTYQSCASRPVRGAADHSAREPYTPLVPS